MDGPESGKVLRLLSILLSHNASFDIGIASAAEPTLAAMAQVIPAHHRKYGNTVLVMGLAWPVKSERAEAKSETV